MGAPLLPQYQLLKTPLFVVGQAKTIIVIIHYLSPHIHTMVERHVTFGFQETAGLLILKVPL